MKKKNGAQIKHGEAITGRASVEYRTWSRMKTRCANPNDAAFHRYGGRGISVCARWMASFENFLADMGRRPSPKHSIDRRDNDGNYTPRNCRWATKSEQNSNYSRNRVLTLDGRSQLLSDWAREVGIDHRTIAARIDSHGYSVADALRTPAGEHAFNARGKDRKTHCSNGHRYTPENSGWDSAGWRFCRVCNRSRSKKYMRKKRAREKADG